MSADVLFTVTKENLENGMRGYPVGYCTTSSVDPEKGLFYKGRPVSELAFWEPINVIYLLYQNRVGSKEEVEEFSQELNSRAFLKKETIEHIQQLPKVGHPMNTLCAALFIVSGYESKNDYQEDCLNLIAKIPEIVAHVINTHAGWGGIKPSNPSLGYMENFAQMLNVPNANLEDLTSVLKLFNVLHYDHGGGNLSTFVGKATASGLQDMWGSIASAMSALAGPKHGMANQDSLEFVRQVLQELGENATLDQVEAYIGHLLEMKQLVFGFGHAVLRVEDPRATVFYELAKEKFPNDPLVKIALLIREAGTNVLRENPKISDPYTNVDAISGTVLSAAGFKDSKYYTVLFGLARSVGIAIQIVYERLLARDGKGVPIYRPKYIFKEVGSKEHDTKAL